MHLKAKTRHVGCRYMRSENASLLFYVCSCGRISLELREVSRNASLAKQCDLSVQNKQSHDSRQWVAVQYCVPVSSTLAVFTCP